MKKINALICVPLVFALLCGSVCTAYAYPYETAVIEDGGALFTPDSGEPFVIPKGETVIVCGGDDESTRVRCKKQTGTVDPSAVEERSDYSSVLKFPQTHSYKVMAENGIPLYEKPEEDSPRIGTVPKGEILTSDYFTEDAFYNYAPVSYGGKDGWIFVESCYNIAELPGEDEPREIITVTPGLRLKEQTADGEIRECSDPIPEGTALTIDCFRDVYYEGGVTYYHTRFGGAEGWLEGVSFGYDSLPCYNTTRIKKGWLLITSFDNVKMTSLPFGEGEEIELDITRNVPVEYESTVLKHYSVLTQKELPRSSEETGYIYDYDQPYDGNYYYVTSCKVSTGGKEGWVTLCDSGEAFTSYAGSVYFSEHAAHAYVGRAFREESFVLPPLTPAECYITYHDDTPSSDEGPQTLYYIGYDGKYGWVRTGTTDKPYQYCTAFEDIPVYASAFGTERVGTIEPGTDFGIVDRFDYNSIKVEMMLITCNGINGWIDRESGDYLLCGYFDASKQLDPPARENAEQADEKDADSAKDDGKKNYSGTVAVFIALASVTAISISETQKRKKRNNPPENQ